MKEEDLLLRAYLFITFIVYIMIMCTDKKFTKRTMPLFYWFHLIHVI